MKHNKKGRTRPMVTEMGMGLLVAIAISIILAIGVSVLIMNGSVAESNVKYFAIPIQFISSFLGALLAGKRIGQKYAIVCGSIGISYCFILLSATIMFFKSSFAMVGIGIGMCVAGCMAACAICMIRKGSVGRRK